jgi:uncharacterized protein YbcV (DUF1398 family)
MNEAISKLQAAMQRAMAIRPKVGGFPYLAECLRQAGVLKNVWTLPAAQSVYVMNDGVVVQQGSPLVSGMHEILAFDEDALAKALTADQEGKSTLPEFLLASWNAGVIGYEVDFLACTVTYRGAKGEVYQTSYPAVDIAE